MVSTCRTKASKGLMIKGLERLSYEERLSKLALFRLEKGKNSSMYINICRENAKGLKTVFSMVPGVRTRGKMGTN